jgi:hypothetical protein
MYTYCPRCKGLIGVDEYFHLRRCPYCNFNLSTSRLRFVLVITGVLIGLVWWSFARFTGPKDVRLPVVLTVGLGLLGVWDYLKERMVRRRDDAGTSLFLVGSDSIVQFWQREAESGRPSPWQTTYATLGARAVGTAQRLRQRWLTRNAADVPERLRWAETNLPEACLFAEAESVLVRMAQSSGSLYGYAFGGLQITPELVEEHTNSLVDLSDLYQSMVQRLQVPATSQEVGEELRELTAQVEAVLKHANLMYS